MLHDEDYNYYFGANHQKKSDFTLSTSSTIDKRKSCEGCSDDNSVTTIQWLISFIRAGICNNLHRGLWNIFRPPSTSPKLNIHPCQTRGPPAESRPTCRFMWPTRAWKVYDRLKIKVYAVLKGKLSINYTSHNACRICEPQSWEANKRANVQDERSWCRMNEISKRFWPKLM